MTDRFRFARILGIAVAGLAAGTTAASAVSVKLPNAKIEPLDFSALNGWATDNHAEAFAAFLNSCTAISRGTAQMRKERPVYGALFVVCARAAAMPKPDEIRARVFFEQNFRPVRVGAASDGSGFLTGYYESVIEGSRTRTDEYNTPIYRKPANLVKSGGKKGKFGLKAGKKIAAYPDRTQIENGLLAGKDLEICWVKSPVDAFFAQIQGSTRVKLPDGKMMRLNYEAHNGQPYTPVGKFLIDRGIVAKEDMSMDRIREWMTANPDEGRELRRKNRSFVFFRETGLEDHQECIGAQGVALTPGRSIAVDRSIHVYGTPFWIEANLPIDGEKDEAPFRRLMVAQDTGSAIIGPARADIYFGSGEEAGRVAGRIKQPGKFVMLVPRTLDVEAVDPVPLPKPRPAFVADKDPARHPVAEDPAPKAESMARPPT